MRFIPLRIASLIALFVVPCAARAQSGVFTHADTLRGANGPARAWWDVGFYDLHATISPADSSLRGHVGVTYRVIAAPTEMQLDLKEPLVMDSVVQNGRRLAIRRDGDVFFIAIRDAQRAGDQRRIDAYYHGKPHVAVRAPWDGGVVWSRDSLGRPWVVTAVQGFGASAWWPTKDTQLDEPDSQRVSITLPDSMMDVSNGRLRSAVRHADGTTTWEWFVANPINNYGVALNAGHYAHWSDVFAGERGQLTLDYYPLAYHAEPARKQFAQAVPMLKCFEHWFGPFPWYEDGYKLVETPHLGMEHQSAVAYGNHFANGYLGRDRSATGWGLLWDFIIIHESAHEWWGNNITTKDIADMWVHESFANYAEALFTECQYGKQAGATYAVGGRKLVRNDAPIVGTYGVQNEGSSDMYDKGGNMLHTIRQVVNDDEKWRGILRGLQTTFRHQVVSGQQVRDYMTEQAGIDLRPVFAQYLETTRIPVFEYRVRGGVLTYRYADVVPGFTMPLRVAPTGGAFVTLRPTATWQSYSGPVPDAYHVAVDENFYVIARNLTSESGM